MDYKTDRVEGEQLEAMAEHYRPQLETYARMWQQCTGEEVLEKGLFFTEQNDYCALQ